MQGATAGDQSEAEPDHDSPGTRGETQKRGEGHRGPERAENVVRADVENPPEGKEVEADHKPDQRPDQVGTIQLPAADANHSDAQSLNGSDHVEANAYAAD
jgi:hypothetical protein